MTYEWDGQRAKRTFIWKTVSILVATLVSVGVPIWIVLTALHY